MNRNDNLVTIARFTSAIEANMARNRLEEAGIPSFLVGEETAAALPLAASFHMIELHVKEADAFRATGILEGDLESDPAPDSGAIQAPSNIVAPAVAPAAPALGRDGEEDEDEEEEPAQGAREEAAHRALMAAILGLLFCPLQLYVLWLLCQVFWSDEELRPAFRTKVWIAAAINAPFILGLLYLLRRLVTG